MNQLSLVCNVIFHTISGPACDYNEHFPVQGREEVGKREECKKRRKKIANEIVELKCLWCAIHLYTCIFIVVVHKTQHKHMVCLCIYCYVTFFLKVMDIPYSFSFSLGLYQLCLFIACYWIHFLEVMITPYHTIPLQSVRNENYHKLGQKLPILHLDVYHWWDNSPWVSCHAINNYIYPFEEATYMTMQTLQLDLFILFSNTIPCTL